MNTAPAHESSDSLGDAISRTHRAASTASISERTQMIAAMLRASDALVAGALDLVGRGGIEAATGMPVELVLSFEARRTGSEARLMTHTAAVLREMPCLAEAFRRGSVSWGQVRAIVASVSRVSVADRAGIDQMIQERAPQMSAADPDRLVELIDDEAARRRPELALAREDRAIEHSFLWIQGRLDGGSSIYGEADAVSTATIVETLDAKADAPVHPDDGPSRAQQRFAALLRICEDTLSGESGGGARPRPRLLATFDVAGLSDEARDAGMQLLWSIAGRPPRLTHVTRETLSCDATIVPVIFDGARPVQVGDAITTFSDKVRTAIIARDRRCRFCGRAPAAWCDAHHIVPGVGRSADDGCLLCRQCHRRVHRYRWRLTLREDGAIEFKRRGQSFLSLPP